MSVCRDLRLYLKVLYFLGMLCASFDAQSCSLKATPCCEKYALGYTIAVVLAALGCFLLAHLQPHHLNIPVHNRTGNIYESISFRSSCLAVCLIYVCLYVRRHRHIRLVQTMLRFNRRCLVVSIEKRSLQYFVLYVAMFLLYMANCVYGFLHSGLRLIGFCLYMTVYLYSYLVMSLVVIFFVCLKLITAKGLEHCNAQLEHGSSSAKTWQWRQALRARQKLLAICAGELNDCFGLVMLPIVALVVINSPSGPFYLISTVFEAKFSSGSQYVSMLLIACFWDVPWLTILLLMLRTDGITVQANKTAKILARIPRTGSGVDRMVEKFLLKNLRQQPILTAYGFFALDKSTLFKLFTAIFTYMVILVQFKEMENSTKSIQLAHTTQSPT